MNIHFNLFVVATKNKKSIGNLSLSLILLFFLINVSFLFSQTENVGIGTTTPDNSAVLDINFSNPANPKGILIPRMSTTDRDAIPSPAIGLLIFNSTTNKFEYYTGSVWSAIISSSAFSLQDGYIFVGNSSNQAIGVSVSGDITLSNTGSTSITNNAITTNKIANDAVNGTKISIASEANGSLMYFNGTDWINLGAGSSGQVLTISGGVPSWQAGTGLSNALNSANIFVGNASNIATGVAMTGDVVINNSGVTTINTSAVTSGKIADGTIVEVDIADNAISTNKMQDGSVTSTKLANDAVGNLSIQSNSISEGKLQNGSVTINKIADGAVSPTKLSLDNGKILVGDNSGLGKSVTMSGDATINNTGALVIADNAITATKISSGVITSAHLASNSVTTNRIQNGAVTPAKIALANNHILVGNASAQAADVAMSGDATINNTGLLTVSGIRGKVISTATPNDGQVLVYNSTSTQWEPKTIYKGKVRAYVGSAQSITSGTDTKLNFDAENFDTGNNFTSGEFTAPVAGYYSVSARTLINFGVINATGAYQYISIYKDGTLQAKGASTNITDSDNSDLLKNSISVSDIVYLAAGNKIDIRVWHNSGASEPIQIGSAESYVSVFFVGE